MGGAATALPVVRAARGDAAAAVWPVAAQWSGGGVCVLALCADGWRLAALRRRETCPSGVRAEEETGEQDQEHRHERDLMRNPATSISRAWRERGYERVMRRDVCVVRRIGSVAVDSCVF